MKGMIFAILGVVLCAGVQAQEEAPLEERMTREEFGRAGLDKLSSEELEFLNAWLQNKVVEPIREEAQMEASTADPDDDRMGFRPRSEDRSVIETSIDGEFRGWEGSRSRYKLSNGQVWQQVGSAKVYFRADSPAVRIEPKSMGSWKMYVDGLGRGVKVKRVK